QHPIIHLSFAVMDYKNLDLEQEIKRYLRLNAQKYAIQLQDDIPKFMFQQLILELSKIEKVVVLIDEYDKPIIDYLEPEQISTAQKHRDILKNFYGILKDSDKYIRFLFITGVSKFSRVSIFSDLNHLLDISLHPKFATLTGYTQKEMESYFSEPIREIAQNQRVSYNDLMEQIRLWYNGYSWLGEKVYNPFSVLCYLSSGQLSNYWFETGSPTFLIKILRKEMEFDFEEVEANEFMMNSYQIENLHPITLLFQTGYLTIQEKRVETFCFLTRIWK
ncbi:MAG: AAA family ATPase, partial [Richelia sp. RM2_1_2]|nr:AAA family ATPase [Richelia sp. RM2_1_2]